MRNHSYEARLKKLHLWSLEERRNRSDISEVVKMFKSISAIPFGTFFQLDNNNRTRGHSAKNQEKQVQNRSKKTLLIRASSQQVEQPQGTHYPSK